MFSTTKKEIIEAGILLDRYELISLTCGNLSVRMPTGEILVTPSGMMYEKMVEDDMIVMNLDGSVIEGTRKPSSDTPAILHILRERPDVNAVIHTHQPYATAISLLPDLTEFRVCITALANAAGGNVPITPYSAAGSIDMGIDTVKYIGSGHAVILSQHGVMTCGKDLNQALYAAVYLEEAAKCYLAARAASANGQLKQMSDAQIQQMVDVFSYYGQGTAKIPENMVKRLD
ncbi:class II aldolase/adducin family protein [Butyricicoccus sp. Marseille-Q5471]|uniref:class II aldolase/adducin family protein n=1 Tax=Butyricicoccus sp. Marseille-Q5471 TaxID=3039493 RepID=UPI0024BC3778|nr:class II aldolase/adducin family protein [Butyricicoccus sp. Marseille-Q5471]